MRMETLIVTFLVYLCTLQAKASTTDSEFLNLWVAEIHGGEEVAQRVARDTGFTYNGPAGPFEDHYELTRDDHPEVSTQHSHHLTRSLMGLDEVKWSEQQRVVKRSKRANVPERFKNEPDQKDITEKLSRDTVKEFVPRDPKKKVGSFMTIPPSAFSTLPSEEGTLKQYTGPTRRGAMFYDSFHSPYEDVFQDPYWRGQWYLHDYRKWNGPVFDHNVVPVYRNGITGEGVTVMVLDEGVDKDHPDLRKNFLEDFSYDFCNQKPGCEPSGNNLILDDHGTMCAGVIAMEADNEHCGVGIAYNAKISVVKTLCPRSSEYRESRGLAHKQSEVSIYSCSWGSPDDGATMERLGRMTVKSINMGLKKGRGGKGSLYVFAAGNGRKNGDNCSADGFVNHIGTIGITSANSEGRPTDYGERCSAVFAATYSGDHKGNRRAVTAPTIHASCLSSFDGTSASAPIAAGILALLLESKPTLSYRDVMHLIAMTAEVAPLADNPDIWYKNGRGFWVSNDFGFGLLNAENMVRMAKEWEPVPEKKTCVITMKPKKPLRFRTSEYLNITIDTEACMKKMDSNVLYVEQIQLSSTIEYPYRGALSIYLTSPQETRTLVLQPRPRDIDTSGLYEWTVKSLHNWGEHARGSWVISVLPVSMVNFENKEAVARRFVLTIHGTSDKPAHYTQPRSYSAFRLPDGSTP